MVLFIPFPTIFSDSSNYNWAALFFVLTTHLIWVSHLVASLVHIAMLDHQSGKLKEPKPLPHKPQQQNHPSIPPLQQVNMNNVKVMGNKNKGDKLKRKSWDIPRTHDYNMKEWFCSERCYVHKIFTTFHRWLEVIGSNLNLLLKLLFYPTNNNP